jgi:hypothetical protein
MAIATIDQLVNAMGNNSSRFLIDKASTANTAAGQFHSLWRATGQPGQGAIPVSVAVPNHNTLGGMDFTQQTSPATSYLAIVDAAFTQAAMTLEFHDRLCHFGGLSGTSTAGQTVSMDLSTLLSTNNLDARKGASDYSDVQWWLEWYESTGATGANATVNVTYNDGSTGNLTAVALGATRRLSFLQSLNSLIPGGTNKFIRGVNTVTLSVSTGTGGNFGVTATRFRAAQFNPIANARFTSEWAQLGLPEIYNSSCIFPIVIASTTNTGIVRATGKVIHG